MTAYNSLPYRPCAGIMLANRAGLIFVGQRLDTDNDAWQMPQGGIDEGEDAETAAIREIGEETGIGPHHFDIIARSEREHFYDLPDALIGKMWKGKYRGQRQMWFLARFSGEDSDVNIATEHPEFRAWMWAEAATLPDLIVPFKRKLYEDVLADFSGLI
ncbi:MAG: RNA pyrophosphohydrolase [Chakrabartia sp.]